MNTLPDTTHYGLVMELRYAARLHLLHERLYRRLRVLFGFVALFGGSAAAVSLGQKSGELALFAGFVLTLLPIVEVLVGPADRVAHHNQMYRAFLRLQGEAAALDAGELNVRLQALRADELPTLGALAPLAYNDTTRSHGHEATVMPLPRWSKLIGLLA